MFVVAALIGCGSASTPEPAPAEPAPAPASQSVAEPHERAAKAPRTADVEALDKALKEEGIVLVDVRSPAEFASGHVPGARNIPLGDVQARLDELRGLAKPEVWLICRSGSRSGLAADMLGNAGVATVNVDGGTLAWKKAGKPVDK